MEQEILDIIKRISYSDRIKELYDNRSKIVEFPLNVTLNYKIISDFNDEYFNKYENILVENALINALDTNEFKYLNFFRNHIDTLKTVLDRDIAFRNKTTELGIKNIINKKYFNKNNDVAIKANNFELFNKIKNVYTKVNTLNNLYREITMKFLNNINEVEKENVLDTLILNNIFDKSIIKLSNNFLDTKKILEFKKILIRLILFDNYLHIETVMDDEDIKNDYYIEREEFENLDADTDYYEDDEYEEDKDIEVEVTEDVDSEKLYNYENKLILNHIKNCIKNNMYVLPNDKNLRNVIYSRFISYNLYVKDRQNDYLLLNENKEKTLNLKKINPLYKLDIINFTLKD